jgi:hypothetical protein
VATAEAPTLEGTQQTDIVAETVAALSRYADLRAVASAELAECNCPEWCERDHANE